MKTLLIVSTVLAGLSLLFAQTPNYNMNAVNQKVKAITDKKLHVIISAIEVGSLLKSPEFLALQQTCETDWNQILENMSSLEGGDDAKKLVFLGMSQLSAQNYATLLEGVTTRYENGEIAEVALKSLLFNEGRMGAFVVDNFSHSRVGSVLRRINSKTTDAAFKQRIAGILSGNAKTSLDEYRDGHVGLAEGNIPKVLLPN